MREEEEGDNGRVVEMRICRRGGRGQKGKGRLLVAAVIIKRRLDCTASSADNGPSPPQPRKIVAPEGGGGGGRLGLCGEMEAERTTDPPPHLHLSFDDCDYDNCKREEGGGKRPPREVQEKGDDAPSSDSVVSW